MTSYLTLPTSSLLGSVILTPPADVVAGGVSSFIRLVHDLHANGLGTYNQVN